MSSSSIISSDGEYTSHTHVSEEFRPTGMTTTPTLQSSNPPDKSIKKQAGTKNWDRTKASRKKTDTGSLCPTRSNSNHSGGVVRLGQIKSDGDSQVSLLSEESLGNYKGAEWFNIYIYGFHNQCK